MLSAILLGGNVTVKKGSDRGGDFKHVRACRSRASSSCVIAFSTFNETPPANAIFGRTTTPASRCCAPTRRRWAAAPAKLSPVYATKPFASSVIGAEANLALSTVPHPKTPWATVPNGVTGRCSHAGGADVLRVNADGRGIRPFTPLPDATWGLHLVDANIALGNLADLVRHQISLYERR